MFSNGSRGTLMSYTDRSMQRRLKSNAPLVSRTSLLWSGEPINRCLMVLADLGSVL